jgi:ankyrin repeat protein
MWAAIKNDPTIVRALVDASADVNNQNNNGERAPT